MRCCGVEWSRRAVGRGEACAQSHRHCLKHQEAQKSPEISEEIRKLQSESKFFEGYEETASPGSAAGALSEFSEYHELNEAVWKV